MSQNQEVSSPIPLNKAAEIPWNPDRTAGTDRRNRRGRLIGQAATFIAIVIAIILGHAMWSRYMDGPWTRDATVRAYVATVAPEVSGNIVKLDVTDNQFVHKGDVLLKIDPTNFEIAVREAQAALDQAKANLQNIEAETSIQDAQIAVNEAQMDQAQAALAFAQLQAIRYEALQQKQTGSVQEAQEHDSQLRQQQASAAAAQATLLQARRRVESLNAQRRAAAATVAAAAAQLDQAKANFERATLRSPVNGWVTNLRAQSGDPATSGKSAISIVDSDSFWIDAYFEETGIAKIRPGMPVFIKLMGGDRVIRGRVGSLSRAIDVANAQANEEGVATVNPVFTWVRLAQRIPVRIDIDDVGSAPFIAAGMTATVQISSASDSNSPDVAGNAVPQ